MPDDHPDDLEELESAEELEALEALPSQNFELLLEKTEIQNCRHTLALSPVPAVLLNSRLELIWANWPFERIFGLTDVSGQNLAILFQADLNEKRRGELYRSITAKKSGFSWYGRIEKKGRDQLSIITNLLILPVFAGSDLSEPVAYQGIFDDISVEFRQMLKNTYESLLEAARLKDNDTGNHIQRVNRYSEFMAECLLKSDDYPEVDREFIQNIGFLAAMHDVGKIGTPDDILNKGGPLDNWEREIMQEHTINGAYILASYPHPMATEIALRHHERWDGGGYPHGMSGDLIPLSARIVALADVYDALRMKRAYKEAMPHPKAAELILEHEDTQFDSRIIAFFRANGDEFNQIYEDLKD